MSERGPIPLLKWTDIKEIIATSQLHLLGRSCEQQVVYDAFRDNVSNTWDTTRDFILVEKFKFDKTVNPMTGKYTVVEDSVNCIGCSKSILVENDFPYHFEKGQLQ